MRRSRSPPRKERNHDRGTLWNSVEQIEKACNSQLARELEVALPIELSREEHVRLVRAYCSSQSVSKGMCADFNIHGTGGSNPHAHMLSQTYKAVQKQLEAEAIALQQEIRIQERQNKNIEKLIQKGRKYVGIEELDGYALRELVSAIYVDAPDKSCGKRVQHIHFKCDGLGFIPLNERIKKKTA